MPIFVACEGNSELGYVRWLNRLADAWGIPVAITARNMKGGAAKAIVEKATKNLRSSAGGAKVFHRKYVILDYDLSANAQSELDQAARIAEKNLFGVVWQRICHECFLLKHFSQTERLNPSTADGCSRALLGVWPEYCKGMDATDYERQLSTDKLARARGNLPELDAFLNDIGWN